MSVFDKFTRANPYVRTYAGAPIQEAMQVVQGLNQRAATNIAAMDKVGAYVSAIPAFGDADKAYKQQYQQKIKQQLDEIQESPEHAGMKVRRAAQEFAADPAVAAISSNAARYKAFNDKYQEDPAKYGDIPAWQLKKSMDAYEAAGGAAKGATFNTPPLYEQVDINKWMRENGKEIAASQNGWAYEKGQFIHEGTKEVVDPNRVRAVLKNAAASDKGVSRQLALEMEMSNDVNGTSYDFNSFLDQRVDVYGEMFGYQKETNKMKGAGKNSSGFSIGGNMNAFASSGDDVKLSVGVGDYKDGTSYIGKMRELLASGDPYSIQMATQMQESFDRGMDVLVSKGTINPEVAKLLKEQGTDAMPTFTTQTLEASGTYIPGSGMGQSSSTQRVMQISEPMRELGKSLGWSDEKMLEESQALNSALQGTYWETDMTDVMDAANTVTIDTEMVDVIGVLELNGRNEAAANRVARSTLSTIDVAQVLTEQGELEDVDGVDFREDYDYANAEIQQTDVNGSGLTTFRIKNTESGEMEIVKMRINPEDNNILSNVAQAYAVQASNENLTPNQRVEFARKGMNVMHPQFVAAAEMAATSENLGKPVSLNFGTMMPLVANKFGNITIEFNNDGEWEAKDGNGTNLFADTPKYRTLMEEAGTSQQAATYIMNYVKANL